MRVPVSNPSIRGGGGGGIGVFFNYYFLFCLFGLVRGDEDFGTGYAAGVGGNS